MKLNAAPKWFRRLLVSILALVLVIEAVPTGFVYVRAAETKVIKVTSSEQLLQGIPAGQTFVLEQDITMGQDQMIPNIDGILDGRGHTVTLKNRTLANTVTGTIQNMIVTSLSPVTGVDMNLSTNSGSFAVVLNGGKLYNCLSTAVVSGPMGGYCGGLAYSANNGAEIRNSIFAGTFKGSSKAGLVYSGWLEGAPLTISNSFYNIDGDKVKKAVNSGAEGSDYKIEGAVAGKNVDRMKGDSLIASLNEKNLGIGYVWEAVDGELPKLVSGGGSVENANLDKLNAAIKTAEAKAEDDYTVESWNSMQKALEKARVVAGTINISQKEVDEATMALERAIAELKKKERTPFPVELPKDGVTLISGAEEFLNADTTDATKYFKLTQDIAIEGGFWNRNLAGVFDGGGHTITLKTADYNGNPLFDRILSTGVVQNLHIKVEGTFPNRNNFAPFATELKGGMIVNCVSHVTGQHSAGFVLKMNGGLMANCLTLGHNNRGALVHYQKSTDHQNTDGYKSGKIFNCYWAASNKVDNIMATAPENLIESHSVNDDMLRSAEFIQQLNSKKGEFGTTWSRDKDGYPYLGTDHGEHSLMQSKYPVEFVWYDKEVISIENNRLELSPQMADHDRFAGTFRLQNVPADSKISWSCEDRANRENIALYDPDKLYVYHDGGAVVRAVEHKADGTQEQVAEIRIVSISRKIEQLQLVMDGKVVGDEILVQGSENKTLDIQARYEGSSEFRSLPPYLTKMEPDDRGHIFTSYNSATFHCEHPGSSRLTVVTKTGDASVSVMVTSKYVPVDEVTPGIGGTIQIHSRNSMGSGEYNAIPSNIKVQPDNASYRGNIELESSDPETAVCGKDGSVVPLKVGPVTLTARLTDQDRTVSGSGKVMFTYANPLVSVQMDAKRLTAEAGKKQKLNLTFTGEDEAYAGVSETELIWSYSRIGIVNIKRPNPLKQIRVEGKKDSGDWVASDEYELHALKPGTVTVTGTPVDQSAGARPVSFTVTVTGDESDIPVFDISGFISKGKETAIQHLMEKNDYSFGQEWNIYTLMRDGQELPKEKLDSYYNSVAATVKSWDANIQATEIERAILALGIMEKDITNVEGVDLVHMICNHPNLTRQGSNALSWGLIALDLNNTPIPADAKWSRESMVKELLTYQNSNGGFGLDKDGGSGVDITAMSLQALAAYQNIDGVQEAVEKGVEFLAKAAEKNLDYGNAESISQVILTLSVLNRDLIYEPGFGDQTENLMSVLSQYMVEGKGFMHAKGQAVNTMATVQAMQALCAYERFIKGESGYWDLKGNRPAFDPVAHVIELIEDLPVNITLKDVETVRAARKAFDALRPEQQEKVTNIDKLTRAEEIIKNFSNDEKKALEVMDLIAALPDTPSLLDEDQVQAARKAYDKLSDAQKNKVLNIERLQAAEKTITDLKAARKVIDAIHRLPQPITWEAQSAVQAARNAYNSLTEAQKEMVVNAYLLDKAELELSDALAVKKVIDIIDALPQTVTRSDSEAVKAARAAYDALKDELKVQVTNLEKLSKAEKSLWDLRQAGGNSTAESNTIDAVVRDGMVSAEQLAAIRGKDKVLRVACHMENGETYTLYLHGKDIAQAEDLNVKMYRKGLYEKEIHMLAENPEIFRFDQKGHFQGPIMVEMETGLANGKYLLLRYDPEQQRAVLVSSVEAKDGKVRFIVSEGGEYFLAQKASAKSIPELQNKADPENVSEDEVFSVQKNADDTSSSQTGILIGIAVLIAVIAFILRMLKKRKENSGE